MGLFSVNYQNVPGKCVYAQGGLKFRADEGALRRYFAPILPYISLNDLIGEAAFWILLPSTVAIWVFPFLLYTKGVLFAVIVSLVLYLIFEIFHLSLYLKVLNYIVFILANHFLSLIVYIICAVLLILKGLVVEAIILGGWFLFFVTGLGQLLSFPLILLVGIMKFFSLPPSDQILRNIGWHYARKMGLDPTKWVMYD